MGGDGGIGRGGGGKTGGGDKKERESKRGHHYNEVRILPCKGHILPLHCTRCIIRFAFKMKIKRVILNAKRVK